MENKRKTKTVRLVPLTRDEALSQPTVLELLSGSVSTPTKEASTSEGGRVEGSSEKLPSAWKSPLLKEKSSAVKEATMSAASSAEKSNTAQISGTPPQNPSTSMDVGSTSEWRPGKNYERNQRRKQRKRLLKGIKSITLDPGSDLPTASNSVSMKRSRESSSTQSTPTSNPKQKRGRVQPEHAEQKGTKQAEVAGTSITASYAGAVRTSNQKLVVTRKGSNGDTPMEVSDLRIIQGAINQRILRTKLDFSVRIERTFIHSGRVLLICYDEKSLEWAQEVVRAVPPPSMDHRGYEARGPKDVKTETFGVWLPDNEGLEIKNVLELVDRCNPDIHLKDIRLKYNAKGSGGMLHVVAVQEPSLKSLEKWDWAPFAGFRRVQFQRQKQSEKSKKERCSEVPTEVQMDTASHVATQNEDVSVASGGAVEPENPNQGRKETSSN